MRGLSSVLQGQHSHQVWLHSLYGATGGPCCAALLTAGGQLDTILSRFGQARLRPSGMFESLKRGRWLCLRGGLCLKQQLPLVLQRRFRALSPRMPPCPHCRMC